MRDVNRVSLSIRRHRYCLCRIVYENANCHDDQTTSTRNRRIPLNKTQKNNTGLNLQLEDVRGSEYVIRIGSRVSNLATHIGQGSADVWDVRRIGGRPKLPTSLSHHPNGDYIQIV